jgi:hypothetical protein
MPDITPAPGLYRDIPHEEYWAWRAVNHSTLKVLDSRSPLHAHHAWTVGMGRSTDALQLGDATHAAVLEPQRFKDQYFQAPSVRRGTKAWNEAVEAAEGRVGLKPDEYGAATRMRDLVRDHPVAGPLLHHANEIEAIEVSWVWKDPETGVLCKARADALSRYNGESALLDLKTTQDASEEGFGRSCAKYWYHTQARFYLDGLQALQAADRRFFFIAVEKDPPTGVWVHELDAAVMEVAAIALRKWLRIWAECEEKGSWPGYPTTIGHPYFPKYAMRWEDDEDGY